MPRGSYASGKPAGIPPAAGRDVTRGEPRRRLSPVRPRVERLQSRLDGLNECADGRGVGLPGEMNAEHISFVGRMSQSSSAATVRISALFTRGAMACPSPAQTHR